MSDRKKLCSMVSGFITDPAAVIAEARRVGEDDDKIRMMLHFYDKGKIPQEDFLKAIRKTCESPAESRMFKKRF